MIYVDGMNGVAEHLETLKWLYSLLSSKVIEYDFGESAVFRESTF